MTVTLFPCSLAFGCCQCFEEARAKVPETDPILKHYVAMEEGLAILDSSQVKWMIQEKLLGTDPQVVAVDPFNASRVYCGTFREGLWVSDDSGSNWRRVSISSNSAAITSLTIDAYSRNGNRGILYVGTEPSKLFRSEDGGENWKSLPNLERLPSSNTWSFPPKPYTHHVRTVVCDPTRPGLIYVAIEAGALIRSYDKGENWEDRVDTGPYDTHNLATNRSAAGRLYSAAGDGFFESFDFGETWQRRTEGLHHTYLYSVAVHASDPSTVLVSCSDGPFRAYDSERADTHVYVRANGNKWRECTVGLPNPKGTTISFLTPDPNTKEGFYAFNNMGVYCSEDAGFSWRKLQAPWKNSFRSQCVRNAALT